MILIRVVDQMVSCCFERVAVFGVEKLDQLFEIQGSIFVLVVGGEMFLVRLFVLKVKCQIFDQKGRFYDYSPISSHKKPVYLFGKTRKLQSLVLDKLRKIDLFISIFVKRQEHFLVPENLALLVESWKLKGLEFAHVQIARLIEIAEFELFLHKRVVVVKMVLQLTESVEELLLGDFVVVVAVVERPPAVDFFTDVALLENFGPTRQLDSG